MPHCDHNHPVQKANKSTLIGLSGEAVGSFTINFYLFALIYDSIAEFTTGKEQPDDFLEVSWPAFSASMSLSLLCLLCTMMIHKILNTNYQTSEEPTAESVDQENESKIAAISSQDYVVLNINSPKPILNEKSPLNTLSASDALIQATSAKIGLTKLQKAALVFDFISHMCEYSGSLYFVFGIATNSESKAQTKLLALAAMTAYGALVSVASIRTCKNALIENNRRINGLPSDDTAEEKADIWTKISAFGEFVTNVATQPYWIGGMLDDYCKFEPAYIGLSIPGMGVGATVALWMSLGTYYAHYALNENGQKASHPSPAMIKNMLLSSPQKLALAGDALSHLCDIASQITFVADLATKHKMSYKGKVLTQCASTLFASACSYPYIRTCINSVREKNLRATSAVDREELPRTFSSLSSN